jgi:hypothetical protein
MRIFGKSARRLGVVAGATAVLVAGGVGLAIATTQSAPPSNAMSHGRGVNEYGMTKAFYKGTRLSFSYTRGFYCDTHVHSTASSKCEAGATFKKAPAKHYDPLYITVPLGFNEPMSRMDCPSGLVCVDHPGTIDLRRLSSALGAPKKALRNVPVPGHDHFITDVNHWKPEWWDVKVVGVTSEKTYNAIRDHRSYAFIRYLVNHKNKHVTAPIPTNLFLYFGVKS